jgi:voltage-gated potassium channel
MNFPRRKVIRLVLLFVAVVVIGTGGYVLIEGWSWNDAIYMAAITLSTVGFGEVRPLSSGGRIFTTLLIFAGVGLIIYFFSNMAEYLVSLNMEHEWHKRRSRNMARKMNNHVIICGFGQVGSSAAKALVESGHQIVVVDSNPESIAAAHQLDLAAIEGDATEDKILLLAGVERAESIIVSTGDDSLNLFVVLSARSINPSLSIIARANLSANAEKLRRAGANRVVSPYEIGGQHMANIVIRPHVTDFFDFVTLPGGEEIWLEEQTLGENCPLVGHSVIESDIRRKTGVTLIAIYRPENQTNFLPDPGFKLASRDKLIVLGTREQLAMLEEYTQPPDEFGAI